MAPLPKPAGAAPAPGAAAQDAAFNNLMGKAPAPGAAQAPEAAAQDAAFNKLVGKAPAPGAVQKKEDEAFNALIDGKPVEKETAFHLCARGNTAKHAEVRVQLKRLARLSIQ